MNNAENKKPKILAFIDGYNFYEGCQTALAKNAFLPTGPNGKPCYEAVADIMWYDAKEIIKHHGKTSGVINQNQDYEMSVSYYTSDPKSRIGNYIPEHYQHFKKALGRSGVNVVEGEFSREELKPQHKTKIMEELRDYKFPQADKFESFLDNLDAKREKQTDVNLAIDIMCDVLKSDNIHTVILVSADSDFVPVIKRIKDEKPEINILILFPHDKKSSLSKSRINKINEKIKSSGGKMGMEIKTARIDISSIAEKRFPLKKHGTKRLDYSDKANYKKSKYPPVKKYRNCECKWGKCRNLKDYKFWKDCNFPEDHEKWQKYKSGKNPTQTDE